MRLPYEHDYSFIPSSLNTEHIFGKVGQTPVSVYYDAIHPWITQLKELENFINYADLIAMKEQEVVIKKLKRSIAEKKSFCVKGLYLNEPEQIFCHYIASLNGYAFQLQDKFFLVNKKQDEITI